MLIAAKGYRFGIFAGHHSNSESDIVSRSQLIHEPADAMRIMRLVASHCSHRPEEIVIWPRYCTFQSAMLFLGVAIGDIVRVYSDSPRALIALRSTLQLPFHTLSPGSEYVLPFTGESIRVDQDSRYE